MPYCTRETNENFMTTFPFHTTVLDNGMLAVPLPEEFRGAPVSVVVENVSVASKRSTMRDFVENFSGILKDCGIESVEALKEERINDMIERHQ
jgi:hypothetical protein